MHEPGNNMSGFSVVYDKKIQTDKTSMDNLTKGIIPALVVISLFIGMHFGNDRSAEPQIAEQSSAVVDSTEHKKAEDVPIFSLRDFNNAIIDIAENANPTVVTVTTKQTVRQQVRNPFSFFFNDPRFEQEREFLRQGLGSGVIVSSENGYIITNNHVIDNADEIVVRLYSGDEFDAKVVGTDPGSDVAVLQIDAENLPAVPMGNSDEIRVGEMVLAIGSPLSEDLAHTVSKGIISATGRSHLGLNQFENYIQTDAAINPGNSGGALINLDGELIGINTAIASRSGGNQGIGFAIPINMVKNVMDALIADGRVARGFLGITVGGEVDRTMARALGMSSPRGFVIGDVEQGAPADIAGLKSGDVVVKKNGQPIRSFLDFRVAVANTPPGTEVELEIFRDGESMTITVELGELDADAVASLGSQEIEELTEQLGFSVEDLTDNIRQQLRLRSEVQGAFVSEISQTSRAYRQGLRQGDVITQISNQPVDSADQFYNSILSFMQSDTDAVLLRIIRQGRNMYVAFEL